MNRLPIRFPSINKPSRIAGFSLIELMVSVVLGIFLVGGVVTIFSANQQNFAVNDNLSRLQESARFAYEQMNREVRDAGTNPCGVRAVNTVIGTPAPTRTIPWWGNWDAGTLRGFDGNEDANGNGVVFGASTNNRVTGTDALIVLRTSNDDSLLRSVTTHSTVDNKITLNTSANFSEQDLMFMCDNASGAIFEIVTPASPPSTELTYDATAPSANCSVNLGWAANVSCNTNSVAKSFTTGSIVTKFDPAIWYVGNTADGRRALYRESIHKNSGAIATERREYVPDVHDMQITYLMRTNPLATDTTGVGVLAASWVSADTINAQTGAWGAGNSNEAVAVRIVLTFRSAQAVGVDVDNKAEVLQRTTVSVISLRNRELGR
jgi:type IV pilus assembly protein PilW